MAFESSQTNNEKDALKIWFNVYMLLMNRAQ